MVIDDLKKAFSGTRDDHPARKSVPYAQQKDIRPKCYRSVNGQPHQSRHGEFYPNPPGCRGIRNG